mgnify:CR=1 FL=1
MKGAVHQRWNENFSPRGHKEAVFFLCELGVLCGYFQGSRDEHNADGSNCEFA